MNLVGGHCQVGSLTGAVASKRVTEAFKGQLSADGNRAMSANAEAGLTVRPTSHDTVGRVYVLYPIANLARDLHCSRSSITRAFTELESSGLLERLHSGFSKPSRILLKVPQNVQGYSSMLCTGASSDGAKVTNVDVQNCIPNHLNRNQQKYNNKQKQKNMPGLPEYMFEEGESL